MKRIIEVIGLLLVVGLLGGIISCGGDSMGLARINLDFALGSPAHSGSRVEHSQLTEVRMGVEEVEFEQELDAGDDDIHENEQELEYEFEGPFAVDLIHNTSDPELPMSEIQPGVYHEIEAELTPVLDGGHSVVIKGTQGHTEFEFYLDQEIEFEIENDSGIELSENTETNILIVLNVNGWIEHIDLSTGETNQDGVVIINATTNSDLLQMISSNISTEIEFGKDEDGDGIIDP